MNLGIQDLTAMFKTTQHTMETFIVLLQLTLSTALDQRIAFGSVE